MNLNEMTKHIIKNNDFDLDDIDEKYGDDYLVAKDNFIGKYLLSMKNWNLLADFMLYSDMFLVRNLHVARFVMANSEVGYEVAQYIEDITKEDLDKYFVGDYYTKELIFKVIVSCGVPLKSKLYILSLDDNDMTMACLKEDIISPEEAYEKLPNNWESILKYTEEDCWKDIREKIIADNIPNIPYHKRIIYGFTDGLEGDLSNVYDDKDSDGNIIPNKYTLENAIGCGLDNYEIYLQLKNVCKCYVVSGDELAERLIWRGYTSDRAKIVKDLIDSEKDDNNDFWIFCNEHLIDVICSSYDIRYLECFDYDMSFKNNELIKKALKDNKLDVVFKLLEYDEVMESVTKELSADKHSFGDSIILIKYMVELVGDKDGKSN